jgi:hypothetical protein
MPPLPAKPSIGSTLPSVKYPTLMVVLQDIANGETPSNACKTHGTTLASLRYHIKQDDELKALFDDALSIGNDALADLLINIDTVHSAPAMAGVISKNIQWYLERRDPTKFGARVQVDMNNNATLKLVTALDAAIARIPAPAMPALPARAITDVEFTDVTPARGKKVGAAPLPAPPPALHRQDAAPPLTEEDLRLLGLA